MSKVDISKVIEVYFDTDIGTYIIEFKDDACRRVDKFVISCDDVPVLIPFDKWAEDFKDYLDALEDVK